MRIHAALAALLALVATLARAEPQLGTTLTRNYTSTTARSYTFTSRSTDTVSPTTTETITYTRFAEGTRVADISDAAQYRADRASGQAMGLMAAAIAPIVVISVIFGPCVVVMLWQYEKNTRKIIREAKAMDINRPWGSDVELAPKEPAPEDEAPKYADPYASNPVVPRGALVAVSVPLLAKPAAAAPAGVATTVVTSFRSAESFFADKYAPQREAAERTIRNCTIAAPILAVAPFVISGAVFGVSRACCCALLCWADAIDLIY